MLNMPNAKTSSLFPRAAGCGEGGGVQVETTSNAVDHFYFFLLEIAICGM